MLVKMTRNNYSTQTDEICQYLQMPIMGRKKTPEFIFNNII